MAAALVSLTALYVSLGALAGFALLCAVFWAVRHCHDAAAGGAKDGGVPSAAGKHEALLNKNTDVAVAVHQPGGGGQHRGPEPGDGDGDVDQCAICKARLADAGWGGCRRLRPCGHVYHAGCVDLWLQRKRVCPVCRAAVATPWNEILGATV